MQSNSNRARHSNYHTDPEEIDALKDRLAIHRRNLHMLEEQRAQYGALDVPLRIISEIAEQKEAVAQIEARLAELSVSVPKVDHGATKPDIWLPGDESLRHVRAIEQLTASKQAEQLPSKLKKLWLPSVWWVPIIVALIGLAGVIITSDWVTPPSPVTSFDYQVRVQAKDTGEYIPNAKVTIEVSGQAPLDGITDSNGLVRIFVGSSHAGKPGMLIVEATGYKRHTQNIDLTVGTLPDVVQLEPVP